MALDLLFLHSFALSPLRCPSLALLGLPWPLTGRSAILARRVLGLPWRRISAPDTLSPCHPARAFFGALTSGAGSGCHPAGDARCLSPSGCCPDQGCGSQWAQRCPQFGSDVSRRLVGRSLCRRQEGAKRRQRSRGELPIPPAFVRFTLDRGFGRPRACAFGGRWRFVRRRPFRFQTCAASSPASVARSRIEKVALCRGQSRSGAPDGGFGELSSAAICRFDLPPVSRATRISSRRSGGGV